MSINKAELLVENKVLNELAETKRATETIKTTQIVGQDSINLQPTGVYQATAASIVTGSAALFKYSLSNTAKKTIHSDFFFTLYQGSVADANRIGHAGTLGYSYRWYSWRDWSSINLAATGYNSTEMIWVENQSGSTQTIICNAEWRYIVNGGTIVVA